MEAGQETKMKTPTEAFREFLRTQREEIKLRSAELSETIGRSETYVHQFEKGAIKDLTLDVFCDLAINCGIMPWHFLQAYYELLWSEKPDGQDHG